MLVPEEGNRLHWKTPGFFYLKHTRGIGKAIEVSEAPVPRMFSYKGKCQPAVALIDSRVHYLMTKRSKGSCLLTRSLM